jgi:hypothetical protein
VSGSANGTSSALGRDGNVEACVLRIQRKHGAGWSWVPAERPEPQGLVQESSEDELNRAGVLRAVLQADQLIGQVLTPRMSGAVSIYHLAACGAELLTEAVLDSEGAFSVTVSDLEKGLWRSGRLVLRVADAAGRHAEGFVSLASFAEIVRQGGPVIRRLLAVIFGTETPEDVSAILCWFLEDPHRLSPDSVAIRGADESQSDDRSEQLVPVAALSSRFGEGLAPTKPGVVGERHWSRFLDQVLAAFRSTRGPFGSGGADMPGDDDEPPGARDKPGEPDPAIDKAYGSFNQLFEILTRNGCSSRHAEIAFDLTGFICARLRPDLGSARAWLASVIRVWLSAGVRPERQEDVAAAILTVLGTAPETASTRRARSLLLQLGRDLSASPPPSDVMHNYQIVLLQQECFADLWARVRAIRTYQEQVHAYTKALECGERAPAGAYPDLPVAASDAWPVLAQALRSPQARAQLLFVKGPREACPVHYMSLPEQEVDKLRTIGIATTKNCCGRVVIRREAQTSIVDLAAAAAAADEPDFVTSAQTKFGGVDPLGLRQLNFDLMDEVYPGINNTARHVRPFVVVAWAWRRAVKQAEATGTSHIEVDELHDFVDRIEVIYVLSQILRDKDADLPGRQYLAAWLEESKLTFGGPKWKKRRTERAYSTALSAPVNYGPGLKMLGWLGPHPDYPGVMLPTRDAGPALDSLEVALRPALKHDAFRNFGSVSVTRGELESWGEFWSLARVTRAEADVMTRLLIGASAPLGRRLGVNLMLAASIRKRSTDTAVLRAAMTGSPAKFTPPREFLDIRDMWRHVQVRQLFRLSLESLFYWMMLNLEGLPRSIDALVRAFLDALPPHGDAKAGDWIRALTHAKLGPTELMDRIQKACDVENRADLPHSVALGLALCLTEPTARESRPQQTERLPLARARTEAAARAHGSVPELMRHVLESWVLAQHSYWSVGRGLADARAGGRTLLRLRIILDEGGWTLTPGAPIGRAPRPTPDRLETTITLAKECGLLERT